MFSTGTIPEPVQLSKERIGPSRDRLGSALLRLQTLAPKNLRVLQGHEELIEIWHLVASISRVGAIRIGWQCQRGDYQTRAVAFPS